MTGTSPDAGAVRRACVIGWPISHSRSPLIHGHWLKTFGIAGSYERVGIPPERISEFLSNFATHGGYAGGNVTIPHKEAAFAAVDEADDTAAALGACNTLWCDGGRLHGSNTDVYGFLANLDASAPGWEGDGGRAVVLGAGGAARAVVHGLKSRGIADVAIANRTRSRADELADRFQARATDWSDLGAALEGADLVVNTTSLGMAGQPPLDIDLAPLPGGACVTDIVYTPLTTPLLEKARARGLATVDGLGMLLHQAVPGFERWFGVRPEVTEELRALLIADLGKPGG